MRSESPSLKIALLFLLFALVACAKTNESVPLDLKPGETMVIGVNGLDYEITMAEKRSDCAVYIVNGETTPCLKNGESWTASDGFKFTVKGLTATGSTIGVDVPTETSGDEKIQLNGQAYTITPTFCSTTTTLSVCTQADAAARQRCTQEWALFHGTCSTTGVCPNNALDVCKELEGVNTSLILLGRVALVLMVLLPLAGLYLRVKRQ